MPDGNWTAGSCDHTVNCVKCGKEVSFREWGEHVDLVAKEEAKVERAQAKEVKA